MTQAALARSARGGTGRQSHFDYEFTTHYFPDPDAAACLLRLRGAGLLPMLVDTEHPPPHFMNTATVRSRLTEGKRFRFVCDVGELRVVDEWPDWGFLDDHENGSKPMSTVRLVHELCPPDPAFDSLVERVTQHDTVRLPEEALFEREVRDRDRAVCTASEYLSMCTPRIMDGFSFSLNHQQSLIAGQLALWGSLLLQDRAELDFSAEARGDELLGEMRRAVNLLPSLFFRLLMGTEWVLSPYQGGKNRRELPELFQTALGGPGRVETDWGICLALEGEVPERQVKIHGMRHHPEVCLLVYRRRGASKIVIYSCNDALVRLTDYEADLRGRVARVCRMDAEEVTLEFPHEEGFVALTDAGPAGDALVDELFKLVREAAATGGRR